MVGFSLKKATDDDTKKPFGFSLKKQPLKPKASRKPFGTADDEDEHKIIAIDTVDSTGQAYNEAEGPQEQSVFVIPNAGNTYKKKLEEKHGVVEPQETKLEYGINFVKTSPRDLRVAEQRAVDFVDEVTGEATTAEEYEKVPVEDFGAAMLRGMGWKGDKVKDEDNDNDNDDTTTPSIKRRPLFLGLGAKDMDKALDDAERLERTYVPVKLVSRRTGRSRSRSRSRSPQRSTTAGYRERS